MTDAGGQSNRTVSGVVVVPPGEGPAEAATLTVVVEDVSRADALARVVAEQRQHQVPLAGDQEVPFAVEVPAERVDPQARYSLRVHADMSGSGDLTDGDYISTQSFPVLTLGAGDEVVVPVQRL